jgi:hypothetical protein
MMIPARAFAAMAALLAACSANACLLNAPPPSAETLIARADAIYLATAVGYAGEPGKDGPGVDPRIEFSVQETLKGPKLARLDVTGRLTDQDDFNDEPAGSKRWIRQAGRTGSCFATRYRQGGRFLLLIRNGSPYWQALTPTNEQVTGPADPWVAWIKRALQRKKTGT